MPKDMKVSRPRLKEPVIDFASFPHIIYNIVSFAGTPVLLAVRTTCRHLRVEVDTKRLARHIVLDHHPPRLLNTHILLCDRPELYKHIRNVDIKGWRCHCDGDGSPTCSCFSCLIKAMWLNAAPPSLDFVRVFTLGYTLCDECDRKPFRANCTIYYLDIPGPFVESVDLPVEPIGGSQRVVINYSYDIISEFVSTTEFRDVSPTSAVQYDILFMPSEQSTSFCRRNGDTIHRSLSF